MGEVDASAENAAAFVFRMLDHGAAHDGDFACAVEQREIDTDFRGIERSLIFGVEKSRIVLRHHRRLAAAVNRRAAELDPPLALELLQEALRLGAWQQHRVTEVT